MAMSAPALSPHAAIAERIIGNIVQASSPAVSPDGSKIAFVVTRVDMEKNKYFSQVWLTAADGSSAPRPVTGGEHDGGPVWAPDGATLLFTSRRSPKKSEATLHSLPVDGPGETRLVATMPDGIDDVQVSPDGRWVAFTSRTQDERYRVPGAEDGDTSWQAPPTPPVVPGKFLSNSYMVTTSIRVSWISVDLASISRPAR